MKLKVTLLFLYAFFTFLLFFFFDASKQLWVSFFINALLVLGIMVYHLFAEKVYSPFISAYIVFNFLFFTVAPIIQITTFEGTNPEYTNYFPHSDKVAIYANTLISIFHVVFFVCYLFFKKFTPMKKIPAPSEFAQRALPITIIVLAVLCVLIFAASFTFVNDEVSRPAWRQSVFSPGVQLIWKKVFFMVPFAGIILCFQYFRKKGKKAINLFTVLAVLLFFFVILFWFKNPLTEKRNALGPIYICFIFLLTPRLLNSNTKTLFFLFLTMIVLFPLSAVFTHTDASFEEITKDPMVFFEQMKGGGISSAFNTLNYDAFSNIMATIDYVKDYGFSMGYQLLSALLFFVPRDLWDEKPYTTGQVVGEHLMEKHDFLYFNLSNPMVSEGFVNFGILGVILMAIALGFVIVKMIGWLKSEDYLKKIMAFYFALHLLFLLRGDFGNGFSYYVGPLIGVILVPKVVQYFMKQLILKQQLWKRSKT